MTPTVARALIYMTGRNCERYVRAAIESVAWQTHAHIHVLFVDDCSDDATTATARALLAEHFPGRHTLVRNPEPWGKARNAHVHLREALPRGDFVAVLDADDQLIRPAVLAEMAAHYAAGYDVVWTNFETDKGGVGVNGPLDPLLSPRVQGWRTSHFFSFRAELFANVPEDYLRDDRGDWFAAACDFAIAFPVLDQTRRYKFMPVRAYRYTASNPNSHHNADPQSVGLSSRRQQACAQQVLAKPALACTRWVLGDRACADEAMLGLRQHFEVADLQGLGQKVDAVAQTLPANAAQPAAAPDAWSQVAAATLAQRCPELLALMMDGQDDTLSVQDAWRWWTWLQSQRPPAGRARDRRCAAGRAGARDGQGARRALPERLRGSRTRGGAVGTAGGRGPRGRCRPRAAGRRRDRRPRGQDRRPVGPARRRDRLRRVAHLGQFHRRDAGRRDPGAADGRRSTGSRGLPRLRVGARRCRAAQECRDGLGRARAATAVHRPRLRRPGALRAHGLIRPTLLPDATP